jgi:peptidoglycan/LPS O-acetylase OafA/YrhL
MGANMRERRYDVDWLRVFAILAVFYFHNARFFDGDWWHIKNAQTSFGMSVFVAFSDVWMMPLFVILSGMASGLALSFRRSGEYALERLKRLLVPLVFGSLVIVAPQVYLERINRGQFHGSYWQFYPHFFSGVYPTGNFSWHHLWFLTYLFAFSIVALPLFSYLRTAAGRGVIARLGSWFDGSRALLLLALPPLLPAFFQASLQPIFHGLQNLVSDWARFLSYLSLFIYGYLLVCDARLGQAVQKCWRAALALGVGLTVVLAFIIIYHDPGLTYSPASIGLRVLRSFNTWFWLLAILGAGRRFLSFSRPLLRYANEAVLPFYVLHQTVIIMIGYYVVKWHAGIPQKYLFISTTALIATLLVYDLAVRRTNVTRFLFGMKVKRRVSEPQPAA